MATLILAAVGSAVGEFIAGPLGAIAGQALGGLGGALLQPRAASNTRIEIGPRLSKVQGLTSMEGAPIPRVFGRARIGGQMIWATRLLEETNISFIPGGAARRRRRRGRRRSTSRTLISPISPSASAKGRSLSSAASGRTGRSSISPR